MQAVNLIFVTSVMSNMMSNMTPFDLCDSYGTCLDNATLMMKFTNGHGCAENETFVEIPQFAICCDGSLSGPSMVERLATNVCLSRPSAGSKMAPGPGCACKKGKDLTLRIKNMSDYNLLSAKVQIQVSIISD